MREYKEIEIPEELLNELVSNSNELSETEKQTEQAVKVPPTFNLYDDDFKQIHDVPEIDDMLEEEVQAPVVREESRNQIELSEYEDPFKNKEHELYRSALDVYEDALVAGNEKVRLAAAKDILLLHGKNKELEVKKENNIDKGNSYTQINISVEAVQKALKDALYGLQGGYKITDHEEEEAHVQGGSHVYVPVEGASEEEERGKRV